MPTKTTLSAISLAIILGTAGCSEAPRSPTASTAQAQASAQSIALSDFFAQSYQEDLARSPIRQSYQGIKDNYDQWDDISDAAIDENIARLQARLAKARQFDRNGLSQQEQLSLDIYIMDIERQLANDEFRYHTYIINQFWGAHTFVPSFLINIHRISEVSDADAYITRINGVETFFDQLITQLRLREEAKVFPPKWSYDQMLQASRNVISGAPFTNDAKDSTIWADFKHKVAALELSEAEQKRLHDQARSALINKLKPAYEKLMSELTKQRLLSPEGDGVWRLPDGDKWYQNRLAWYTTTDLTAEEVHQLGLYHVERIHNDMRQIMAQVGFAGSLSEFFAFMRTDPQFYYEDSDAGRDAYMRDAKAYIDAMEQKIPEYFGLIPQADMIIKRVEPFREQSAGKAFYQAPSQDGSRPGIYYANLYDMSVMPSYQMEALAYHEGIPGHHMQRAITQELTGIPEFQKYASFTAYTEGWGLYTEELPKEMGFYQDPYSDFGRLAMELWRACRLVVDTGLHDKQWSREKAIAYLVENTPNSEYDAVKAIERYIALPGQATAYMIGKLEIQKLRAKAEAELGDQFDLKGFHDEVLKDGPVPLNILAQKIDNWIASQ